MGIVVEFPRSRKQTSLDPVSEALLQRGNPPAGAERIENSAHTSPVEKLREILLMAEKGRVGSFVFLSQDPETNLFFTCLNSRHEARAELFALIGVLETLKMELTEMAAMAPAVDKTGAIIDPF